MFEQFDSPRAQALARQRKELAYLHMFTESYKYLTEYCFLNVGLTIFGFKKFKVGYLFSFLI